MSRTIVIQKVKGQIANEELILEQLKDTFQVITNGTYVLTLEKRRSQRTIDQNRLMWLWFACLSDYSGHTPPEMKKIYCDKYFGRNIEFRGENYRISNGTRDLTKKTMSVFLDFVKSDAATYGVILPEPTDRCFEAFREMYEPLLAPQYK